MTTVYRQEAVDFRIDSETTPTTNTNTKAPTTMPTTATTSPDDWKRLFTLAASVLPDIASKDLAAMGPREIRIRMLDKLKPGTDFGVQSDAYVTAFFEQTVKGLDLEAATANSAPTPGAEGGRTDGKGRRITRTDLLTGISAQPTTDRRTDSTGHAGGGRRVRRTDLLTFNGSNDPEAA